MEDGQGAPLPAGGRTIGRHEHLSAVRLLQEIELGISDLTPGAGTGARQELVRSFRRSPAQGSPPHHVHPVPVIVLPNSRSTCEARPGRGARAINRAGPNAVT